MDENRMSKLFTISPIDGRYSEQTRELSNYFSEYAFIKYRIQIEIDYFIQLKQIIPELQTPGTELISDSQLKKIYERLSIWDVTHIKHIEEITKHDVKAIEYFIKQRLNKFCENNIFKEFIHFGLTSQDVNSVAISLSIKDCLNNIIYNKFDSLNNILIDLSLQWKDIPMLGRTHGQPAIPTVVGKEIKVFQYRFNNQLTKLKEIQIFAKFGGAVGNLNAHYIAYPDINWKEWCNNFISNFGLNRSEYTTQVDNNDSLAELFDNIKRINIILIDLVQDMWQYILLNYFKIRIGDGEIGSSTMPQKVNPINFENAEGNFLLCNTLLEFFSKKLPISRLQRDLTDSTVSRNIGMIFGYLIVALNSLMEGLNKISVNKEIIENDLESHWEIISEAIQTILRKYGYSCGYENIKEFTQNKIINRESIHNLIRDLTVNEDEHTEICEILLKITPHNYIGKY